MSTNDSQRESLKKLENILNLVQEGLTKSEFVAAFEGVVDFVQRIQATNDKEFTSLKADLTALSKKVREDASADVSELRQQVELVVSAQIVAIKNKLDSLKNGEPGPKGDTVVGPPGPEGPPGPAGAPDTGDQIIGKINKADDLISSTAIEGLEDFKKEVKDIKIEPRSGFFGRSLLQLYVDGAKKGAVQYLNIVAGANVTLSYNRANGRNDITISATGGSGSLSVLAATGTIDDSNVTFTFASTPTLVIVNGACYRDGKGCSIVTTTVTLDNPVGTGGDVYALG